MENPNKLITEIESSIKEAEQEWVDEHATEGLPASQDLEPLNDSEWAAFRAGVIAGQNTTLAHVKEFFDRK